jgi:hypothetical protein
MISDLGIGKDMEGSDRGPIWDTIHEFVWRNWEQLREPSVRIDCLYIKIWTRDPQNAKQECWPIDRGGKSLFNGHVTRDFHAVYLLCM